MSKIIYNKLNTFILRHYKSLVPFLTIHKCLNILCALFEMKGRKIVCKSRPFIFNIDPCSVCDLRCPMCPTHNYDKKDKSIKRIMDLNSFKKIIDKISEKAIRVSLYDSGEPFLNRQLFEMIKYCSLVKIGTSVSTHFNDFSHENINDLFESKLTRLLPCLDGFTQVNYEKYRVGGNVEKVKKNIELVMNEKRKRKSKWPIVDVQVVLFEHIKSELEKIATHLANCHVDKVTYKEDCRFFHYQSNIDDTKIVIKPCFKLYVGMMIRPDGNVYPCSGGEIDRFSYGNIHCNSLSEIWNNKYFQFSRSLFSKNPPTTFNDEMSNIPCLKCSLFKIPPLTKV